MSPRSLAPWTVLVVLVAAAFVALGPGRRSDASAQAVVRVGPTEPIIEMDLAKIDAAYEARDAFDDPMFAVPASIAAAPETEAPVAAPGVGDTIEGRVVLHDPLVRADEVRVVAIPAGYVGWEYAALERHMADPEAHGWFETTCEGDGSFVLGPGLEPSRSYRVVAGGGGVAHTTKQVRLRRTGDFVLLDMYPILGVEVTFEDADGRPIDWRGHMEPRAWIVTPERLRSKYVLPPALVLNGLPDYNDPEGRARRFVMDGDELAESVECRALVHPHGFVRIDELIELRPVRDGLHRVTVRAPFRLGTSCPLTVRFPEDLASNLVGDAERSSLRLRLILTGENREEMHLAPFVTRGSCDWTTSVPAGRYRAELMLARMQIPLTSSPRNLPVDRDDPVRTIEVGPEGATLFVPDVPHATVRLVGVEDALGTTPNWLIVDQHLWGSEKHETQQVIRGRPLRFPVFLHRDEESKERTFHFGAPDRFVLVDKDGTDRFVLSPGDELTLRPIPRETSTQRR